ncbi:MAG: hypothetical protein WDN23_21120 [Edaphobacter sp.]
MGWADYSAGAGPANSARDILKGTDYAPNQYRLALPYLIRFLARTLHVRRGYLLTGALDGIAAYVASYLLYLRLARSSWISQMGGSARAVAVALFLAALQFPIAWVVPWQRPETLPSAAYLAASLLIIPRAITRPVLYIVLFLLTLWQAFVRSDIPFVFGLSMILLGFLGRSPKIVSDRWALSLCGMIVAGTAAVIQMMMKYVFFPNAVYPPGTALVQLTENLSLHRSSTAAVALLPCFVLLWLGKRVMARLDPMDWLTILSSVLYLPLWLAVGVASEVRIYVPFLLILCPVAAKILSLYLTTDGPNTMGGRRLQS